MTTPKSRRKFGWMKRLVNGGKEGENSPGAKDVVQSNSRSDNTNSLKIVDNPQAQNSSQKNPSSYSVCGSVSGNNSVYSQPQPGSSNDFYDQIYDGSGSDLLYPSRMDNSSTEGIKSFRDNHSMQSGSVLTDVTPHPVDATIGSPRSITKSVGWQSASSHSIKSIKSTDSLKSGIAGHSWKRHDYYKLMNNTEVSDDAGISNADEGPTNSMHSEVPDSDRPGRSQPSSSSNAGSSSVRESCKSASSSLHDLRVSVEGLAATGSDRDGRCDTDSETGSDGEPDCIPLSSPRNGHYSSNPNAAARSTSYSSSLSTSGLASPSIMSQNSDGASTSYTVPSAMHHVQLPPQQNLGPGHIQNQTVQVNTVPSLDNASIITLASSSKRRRRRSVDTMASTRGIAPASLYVNRSVESLPIDTDTETNNSVET